MTNFLPGMFPAAAVSGGGKIVKAEYIGAVSSTANREDNYVFNDVPIGAISPDRICVFGVLCVGSGDDLSFSSLTVDGVDAERVLPNRSRIVDYSNHPLSFFTIAKPTGTTANIVVSFPAFEVLPNIIVFVWAVRNASGPFAFSAGATEGNGTSLQVGLTAPERGALLFVGGHQNTNPATYSSAELVDSHNVENRIYDCAQLLSKKENTSFTETRSWSGAANSAFAGVAFQPVDTGYPTLAGRALGGTALDNTPSSFSAPLPPNIQAGDMIVVVVSLQAGAARAVSTPSGWTKLFSEANGNVREHCALYRIATGSEGDSLSLSANGSSRWSTHAYRISKHKGRIAGATATGSSAQPNPPSVSPPWGTGRCLWIVTEADTINPGNTGSGQLLYPSGYFYGRYTEQIYLGNISLKSAAAIRFERTATLDPPNFTIFSSGAWVASTIAIE